MAREWHYDRKALRRDALRRDILQDVNGGIISSAAIIQGLTVAGATGHEAVVGVTALIIIGAVAAATAKYSQTVGERKAVLAVYRFEREALTANPEREEADLVRIYEEKGLSPDLAKAVARELTEKDALRAQLDDEFDISRGPSAWWPVGRAILSGLAFVGGTAMPLIFLLVLPWNTRGEVTLVFVVVALGISGWLEHYSEHTAAWRSMVRTILLGLITLGVSTYAGERVNF